MMDYVYKLTLKWLWCLGAVNEQVFKLLHKLYLSQRPLWCYMPMAASATNAFKNTDTGMDVCKQTYVFQIFEYVLWRDSQVGNTWKKTVTLF